MLTTTLISRARALAEELHEGQTRKSSGRSYFDEHLCSVADLVATHNGTPEAVAAALLHDAIEDQPEKEPCKRILATCGAEVLALVEECTEVGTGGTEKAPWQVRKDAYLAHLAVVSPSALLISIADKLQSAGELAPQVAMQGDEAYKIFKVPGKEGTLWFHHELVSAFANRIQELRTQGHDMDMTSDLFCLFKEKVAQLV